MTDVLPAEISADIGSLIDQLTRLGLKVDGSEYDPKAFGDFYVDFSGSKGSFRIIRDRSQYLIDGEVAILRKQGLFRSFDSRDEFSVAVLEYAKTFG